jgi:hypothetical protein
MAIEGSMTDIDTAVTLGYQLMRTDIEWTNLCDGVCKPATGPTCPSTAAPGD